MKKILVIFIFVVAMFTSLNVDFAYAVGRGEEEVEAGTGRTTEPENRDTTRDQNECPSGQISNGEGGCEPYHDNETVLNNISGQQEHIAEDDVNLCDYGMCFGEVYEDPAGKNDPIPYLAKNVILLATRVAAALAILIFMSGGVYWMVSFGDENSVGAGKKMMMYSVIGLVVVFASYVLVTAVLQVLYALGA